jgi:hypothetical protein
MASQRPRKFLGGSPLKPNLPAALKLRKCRDGSSLKPKPVQIIGVGQRVAACLKIFKKPDVIPYNE